MGTELDEVGPGSLKLFVASDDEELRVALGEWFDESQSHRIAPGAWVAFGPQGVAELRDAIGPRMADGRLMIVEFERWSFAGGIIDPAWLLRRGH